MVIAVFSCLCSELILSLLSLSTSNLLPIPKLEEPEGFYCLLAE